jgi:hypothetical protein
VRNKHSPWKGRNCDTPIVYSGRAVLRKEQLAYLLKTKTVETEKQPLVANGSETTFLSRQRLDKHYPAATDTHAQEMEMVFSTQSLQRGYRKKIEATKLVLYRRL